MSLRRQLIYPVLAIALGGMTASIFELSNITQSSLYTHFTYALLAIGLYGCVFTINLRELNQNRQIVLGAITVGVFLKTVIIGAILYFFIKDNIAFLLGVAVAQIDPLSVAALLNRETSYLSERAKAILGAWSSFDDPVTVILSLYILSIVLQSSNAWLSFQLFVQSSAINLLVASGIYVIHQFTKRWAGIQLLLLLISLFIGIYFRLMLAVALTGLFLRPAITQLLSKVVDGAFYTALLLLGLVLINGISPINGAIMAFAAVVAQIIVSIILTRKLHWRDRLHIALAQQNGITAIILALLFETTYTGVVAVVAPAILLINLIHFVSNSFINQKFG